MPDSSRESSHEPRRREAPTKTEINLHAGLPLSYVCHFVTMTAESVPEYEVNGSEFAWDGTEGQCQGVHTPRNRFME